MFLLLLSSCSCVIHKFSLAQDAKNISLEDIGLKANANITINLVNSNFTDIVNYNLRFFNETYMIEKKGFSLECGVTGLGPNYELTSVSGNVTLLIKMEKAGTYHPYLIQCGNSARGSVTGVIQYKNPDSYLDARADKYKNALVISFAISAIGVAAIFVFMCLGKGKFLGRTLIFGVLMSIYSGVSFFDYLGYKNSEVSHLPSFVKYILLFLVIFYLYHTLIMHSGGIGFIEEKISFGLKTGITISSILSAMCATWYYQPSDIIQVSIQLILFIALCVSLFFAFKVNGQYEETIGDRYPNELGASFKIYLLLWLVFFIDFVVSLDLGGGQFSDYYLSITIHLYSYCIYLIILIIVLANGALTEKTLEANTTVLPLTA